MFDTVKKFLMRSLSLCGLGVLLSLVACHSTEPKNQLTVGTIDGPETALMTIAQKIGQEKYGLNIKIVTFTDYTLPNQALNDGSIDVNMFQTIPYLHADAQMHGYDFKIVGNSFLYPMAVYSKKIKSLKDLPNKATIAIPNDPSNEARALLLLQKGKLIQLKQRQDNLYTPSDIAANPHQLQFKELDAAQIPRVLSDVTLAAINTNYAIPAGLYPKRDGLIVEDKHSPYMNVFVVKAGFESDPRVAQLLKAFQNPKVLHEAQQLFNGQAIAGW